MYGMLDAQSKQIKIELGIGTYLYVGMTNKYIREYQIIVYNRNFKIFKISENLINIILVLVLYVWYVPVSVTGTIIL